MVAHIWNAKPQETDAGGPQQLLRPHLICDSEFQTNLSYKVKLYLEIDDDGDGGDGGDK